jgi:arsenate reductase
MSFTTTMFDELILELGELATMRDEALRRREIAASATVKEAVDALSEAVAAMARAALRDGAVPEVAAARIALSRAQRLFGPVGVLLAEPRAAEQERMGVRGDPALDKVIFACVHSAGRSQMAAAFFNRLADPQKAWAMSAGTEPAERVHPEVVEAMRECGYDLSAAHPARLGSELAASASLLVTMGCGEACPYVPGLRREDWVLDDPKGRDQAEVRRIREQIRERVERLMAERGWLHPSS